VAFSKKTKANQMAKTWHQLFQKHLLFPVHFRKQGWEVLPSAFHCGNFEKITHCHSLCAY
jgi:hypothetical protein